MIFDHGEILGSPSGLQFYVCPEPPDNPWNCRVRCRSAREPPAIPEAARFESPGNQVVCAEVRRSRDGNILDFPTGGHRAFR